MLSHSALNLRLPAILVAAQPVSATVSLESRYAPRRRRAGADQQIRSPPSASSWSHQRPCRRPPSCGLPELGSAVHAEFHTSRSTTAHRSAVVEGPRIPSSVTG